MSTVAPDDPVLPGLPVGRVVASYGRQAATAPLVVLLHGRGSDEQEILDLATHLPDGPA